MPKPATRPSDLALCSLNARGLGARAKLQALLDWAASSRFDIVAIQDHQLPTDPFLGGGEEEGSRVVWKGEHFFVAGTPQNQGVLLLLSPRAPISEVSSPLPSSSSPPELRGRHLRVDFLFGAHPISLHTVYAPAQPAPRQAFFEALSSHAFSSSDGREHVLCGDFNTTLGPLDRVSRSGGAGSSSHSRGSIQLQSLVTNARLVDVWRDRNSGERDLTFWASRQEGAGGYGSRIDRFYVSSNLSALPGTSSTILHTAPISTDHLPVVLTLPGPTRSLPNASSRWHFPVHLLAMPEFVSYVREWLASVLWRGARGRGGPAAGGGRGGGGGGRRPPPVTRSPASMRANPTPLQPA